LGTQASQISGHLANEVVAIAEWGSPYIGAYPWTDASGFGTKYADPATAVPDRGNQVRWSPDKKAIGIAHDTSPYVSVYAWSDALGFGTKYANPGTTPTGSGKSINFSADNSNIVVGHATSPYISAYPWSSSSGFGTKYSNPSELPDAEGGSTTGVAFNPLGTYLVTANSWKISAYAWSSGFGARTGPPSWPSTGTLGNITFSPDGNYVSAGTDASPFIYTWGFSSGWGTKVSNPGTLPLSAANQATVAYNNQGTLLAITSGNQYEKVALYAWSSGYGTKYANPWRSDWSNSPALSVAFNSTGTAIFCAFQTSPWIEAFIWDGSQYQQKYAAPSTPPTGRVYGVISKK